MLASDFTSHWWCSCISQWLWTLGTIKKLDLLFVFLLSRQELFSLGNLMFTCCFGDLEATLTRTDLKSMLVSRKRGCLGNRLASWLRPCCPWACQRRILRSLGNQHPALHEIIFLVYLVLTGPTDYMPFNLPCVWFISCCCQEGGSSRKQKRKILPASGNHLTFDPHCWNTAMRERRS